MPPFPLSRRRGGRNDAIKKPPKMVNFSDSSPHSFCIFPQCYPLGFRAKKKLQYEGNLLPPPPQRNGWFAMAMFVEPER